MAKKNKPAKASKKKSKRSKSKVVVANTSRRGKLTPLQSKRHIEAITGNRWFELRAKHGRDKLFESPQLLMESAIEYFKWCEDNLETKGELVKYEGGAIEYPVTLKRPYTMEDLCRYIHCNTAYFRQFKSALAAKAKENWTPQDNGFSTVIECIEEIVRSQQIRGALVGHFNANIISRLIGLVDKKDVTTDGNAIAAPEIKVYNVGPKLSNSEEEVEK